MAKKNSAKKAKRRIGRIDRADFPELRLYDIAVKIDTGAYTSSIHCENIRTYNRNGKQFLRFNVLDEEHPEYDKKGIMFREFSQKIVKNSFGESEERFVIESTITLFDETFGIELALTDRGSMKYPVLLGRKILEKQFIVDVSRTFISFNKKAKQKNKSKQKKRKKK